MPLAYEPEPEDYNERENDKDVYDELMKELEERQAERADARALADEIRKEAEPPPHQLSLGLGRVDDHGHGQEPELGYGHDDDYDHGNQPDNDSYDYEAGR